MSPEEAVTLNPGPVEVSKHEMRSRATAFSVRFADAHSEVADKQSFWNDFFAIFNITAREVGSYEVFAHRLSTDGPGWIDYLSPGRIGVEHKSLGEDLDKAMDQLLDYLPSLPRGATPKLLVVCDFQHFYWKDLEHSTEGRFNLSELSANLELFWWLAGYLWVQEYRDEELVNLEATGYMAQVYDAVMSSGYSPHAVREWLTRVLFCLFADHTQVWDRNAFTNFLILHTREDGFDLGSQLAFLFQVLNTPPEERPKNLDEDLAVFTYINGDLFAELLPIPSCDGTVRDALIKACHFDWSVISPAVFGSMFQNVMTPQERREIGAHYTTEENILRTIRPLFLDELEKELERATSKAALDRFHERLASLRFLDPACGCGNFLVIAYRELRRLEHDLWAKRARAAKTTGETVFTADRILRVKVDQFYGIELEEFPARIARTALYLGDHLANLDFSRRFGQYFVRFPIPAAPHIRVGNALRFDWNELVRADQCTYIFGNPPFVGMSWMNAEQQDDKRHIFAGADASLRTGRLDYVACWYEKTMDFVGDRSTKFAYVSTNSLFQGEQARTMGPLITNHGFELDFAHTTFAWRSEAQGAAHVHCIIAGLSRTAPGKHKMLFEYETLNSEPTPTEASNINAYLADGPMINLVRRAGPFIEGLPIATQGNKPTDGGHLLVSAAELPAVQADPIASRYLRRFVQGRDMLHNDERWCLWLVGAPVADMRSSAVLRQRLEAVRHWRATESGTESVREAAATPALFTQIRQPTLKYLAMPEVSSSGRNFIPGQYFDPSVIAGNKLIVVPDAPVWLFGLFHSSMWNAWMRSVSGRLKSDISFSPNIGYFCFPTPELDAKKIARIEAAAQGVLDARAEHADSTLADLYDPLTMPPDLVSAHQALDSVVDRTYTKRRMLADADRLAVLFARYQLLTSAGVLFE